MVSICWVLSSMTLTNLQSVSDSAPPRCLYLEQGTNNDQLCLAPVRMLESLWPKVLGQQQPSLPALLIVSSLHFSSCKRTRASLIITHSRAGIWDTHKCCLIACHNRLAGGNHRRLFLWGIQRIVRLKKCLQRRREITRENCMSL